MNAEESMNLYAPTKARMVPMKNRRRSGFSATNQMKAPLNMTEHPSPMPATERWPGQPKDAVVRMLFQSSVPGSLSVKDAINPAMLMNV
jgi:hypothetical protein